MESHYFCSVAQILDSPKFSKDAENVDFFRSSNSIFKVNVGFFLHCLNWKPYNCWGEFFSKNFYAASPLRLLIVLRRFENLIVIVNLSDIETLFSRFSEAWIFPSRSQSKTLYLQKQFYLKKYPFRLLHQSPSIPNLPSFLILFYFDDQTHNSTLQQTRFLPSSIEVSTENLFAVGNLWIQKMSEFDP